jgi:hypothetical protein
MAVPIMAIAGLAMGGIQAAISASKASNLPKDRPYTVSPELRAAYTMARRRADEGYTPEERASFEQMLARQGTAAKQMFRNMGMAGAGSAAANIMGIDALNQFAATGAGIRRQNEGAFYGLAGQMQGVQDQETGRFNQQLNMERQALGQGMQAGIGNIMGAVGNAQQFMGQQQAIDLYKNMGAGGSGSGGGMGLSKLLGGLSQGGGSGMDFPFQPMQQSPQVNWGGFRQGMMQPQPQQNMYGFNPGFAPRTFSNLFGTL